MDEVKIIFLDEENKYAFIKNNAYRENEDLNYNDDIPLDKNKLKGIDEIHIKSNTNIKFANKMLETIYIYKVTNFDDVSVKLEAKDLMVFVNGYIN